MQQGWLTGALVAALCSGCLDPLVDDQPGYSRYVLPPEAQVVFVYDDLQLNRKVDMNDGLTPPLVALKSGWADGQEVAYWDLGAGKRQAAPAYVLAECGADGRPLPDSRLDRWPIIVETLPGDTDYSPFRALNWACVTPAYQGQIIGSSDALSDAIELGLVGEPAAADTWANLPIVGRSPMLPGGVELAWSPANRTPKLAYYKGKAVYYHAFEDQEGRFSYEGKALAAGNVYEVVKIGFPGAVRVIFSQPYEKDGARNPAYSPQWALYTITLKALVGDPITAAAQEEQDIQSWVRESDIVNVNPTTGAVTPKHARVLSATASVTSARVNRPFVVHAEAP